MKNIAIIGGGIAGISAAYYFQERYKVTLFEKQNYIGGNNRSIDIGNGIKVPLVVILFPRKKLFSQTISLANKFGLKVQPKVIGHSFWENHQMKMPSLLNSQNYSKFLLSTQIFKNLRDLHFMLRRFPKLRFTHQKSIQDLTELYNLPPELIKTILIPLACLYLTMSYKDVSNLPLNIFADWYYKYMLYTPWASRQFSFIKGGNHQLVDKLINNTVFTSKLETPIQKVHRNSKNITICANDQEYDFDKVIFSTPPITTLSLLSSPSSAEKNILSAFETQEVKCTLHTAKEYSYKNKITLNTIDNDIDKKQVITTYSEECFDYDITPKHFVTIERPDSNLIPTNKIIYHQNFTVPKTTVKSLNACESLPKLNDNNLNSYFCGASFGKYFYHEDAIVSSQIINSLDKRINS
ncbi:hypothetical protein BVY03_04450 [bacterium K02(2017)]|nr:hypothetical protein BVY03_04450 [bacterium K02(2017)]